MNLKSPHHDNDESRVRYNLTLHTPNAVIGTMMTDLRRSFKETASHVCDLVPQGRERSMALTAIEDACMYAIAGLARAVEVAE